MVCRLQWLTGKPSFLKNILSVVRKELYVEEKFFRHKESLSFVGRKI